MLATSSRRRSLRATPDPLGGSVLARRIRVLPLSASRAGRLPPLDAFERAPLALRLLRARSILRASRAALADGPLEDQALVSRVPPRWPRLLFLSTWLVGAVDPAGVAGELPRSSRVGRDHRVLHYTRTGDRADQCRARDGIDHRPVVLCRQGDPRRSSGGFPRVRRGVWDRTALDRVARHVDPHVGRLPVERGPAVVGARDGGSISPPNRARYATLVALFLPPDLQHLHRWHHPLRVGRSPSGVRRLCAYRAAVAGWSRVVLTVDVGRDSASLLSPVLDALDPRLRRAHGRRPCKSVARCARVFSGDHRRGLARRRRVADRRVLLAPRAGGEHDRSALDRHWAVHLLVGRLLLRRTLRYRCRALDVPAGRPGLACGDRFGIALTAGARRDGGA